MILKQTGFIVYPGDNVGTAVGDIAPGPVRLLGADPAVRVEARCDIPFGHKFALRDLAAGDPIIKYGARIGTATREIQKGDHVHLHNMKSDFDEHAANLDEETAAAMDIEYKVY